MTRIGSLTVVGTGITYFAHLTAEARAEIGAADKVWYAIADPATDSLIRQLNPSAESLHRFYVPGKPRTDAYREMIDAILYSVRKGLGVCAVFYGHPGIFVSPGHEAVTQARKEGFDARMLPGISADACLFADLGVDPGTVGCQSFEATDFLIYQRRFDPASALVLWQIGAIGTTRVEPEPNQAALRVLGERLASVYGNDWNIVLYQAPQFPASPPVIERTTVGELPGCEIGPFMTLYIPPKVRRRPESSVLKRIGILPAQLSGGAGG